MNEDHRVRCQWAVRHPELMDYHDNVWGKPTRDDSSIFAAYAQCILHAGLLWTAMLKKRPVFSLAFEDWDIERISHYDGTDMDRLIHTEGMIRNFQKINSITVNARKFIEIRDEFGSFADYIWKFVDGEPLICDCRVSQSCNTGRREADLLSADMKKRGFKFAGPATAYGLMEDIGMVNDHDTNCFRKQG